MLIYFFILFFIIISGIFMELFFPERKNMTILYLFFCGIILTLFSSFRYAIGYDYFSYRTIFYEMSALKFTQILQLHPTEFLFYSLNKIVFLLGGNYTAFLFIISAFIHSIVLCFIQKYSKIPWLSLFLYICFQFFAHNMNLLRQSIAAVFFLCAFPYLKEKKFLPYAAIIFIGALFHNSLLIMLPLFFFLHLKLNRKMMAGLLFLFSGIYLWFDPILTLFAEFFSFPYMQYQNSIFWQANSFTYLIFPSAYFFFVCFYAKDLLKREETNLLFISSAFYTFYINLFITKHFILERFSIYPFLLSMLVIPEIVSLSEANIKCVNIKSIFQKRNIKIILVVSLGIAYFLFASTQKYHGVYPYHHLLERAFSHSVGN